MSDRHQRFYAYGTKNTARYKPLNSNMLGSWQSPKTISASMTDLVEFRSKYGHFATTSLPTVAAKPNTPDTKLKLMKYGSRRLNKGENKSKNVSLPSIQAKKPFIAELDERRAERRHHSSVKKPSALTSSKSLPTVKLSSEYLTEIEKRKTAEMRKRQALKWTAANYKAKLVNMTGPCKKFNNVIVYPERYYLKGEKPTKSKDPNCRFKVYVQEFGSEVEMLVGPNNIYVLSVIHKAIGSNQVGKSENKSVTQTMTNLCNQIKKVIMMTVDKKIEESGIPGVSGSNRNPVKEAFESMDVDSNGVLDMKEMLSACQQVDVNVTEEQLALIWPMFDSDGNGEVDIDEFFSIITHHEDQLETEKKELTTNQRRRRIQERTDMAKYFIEVSNNVRNPIVAHMIEKGLSSKEFFKIMDDDGSGDIDKEELLTVLVNLNVSVSMNELHLAFAAMDEDEDGGISEKEWHKFIKGGKKWEMAHTEKMQQTRYLRRLQHIMMQPQ